jgi:hypothetical protein
LLGARLAIAFIPLLTAIRLECMGAPVQTITEGCAARHSAVARLIVLCGGQSGEILQNGRDKRPVAWILALGGFGKKIDQIMRLPGSFSPIRRRRGKQMAFQQVPPFPKRPLIGPYLRKQAARLGGLLGHHPAVPVEIDWLVAHACTLLARAELN